MPFNNVGAYIQAQAQARIAFGFGIGYAKKAIENTGNMLLGNTYTLVFYAYCNILVNVFNRNGNIAAPGSVLNGIGKQVRKHPAYSFPVGFNRGSLLHVHYKPVIG